MNRLKSRKLWVAVGTVVSILLAEFAGIDISPEAIAGAIVMASTYVFSQGLVDKSVVTAQVQSGLDVGKLQLELYAKNLEAQLEVVASQLQATEIVGGLTGVPSDE